jgi:hypothetical protein
MLKYFMAFWNILGTFWIFYDHLVHFVFCVQFWYHVPRKIWQPCPQHTYDAAQHGDQIG